MRLEHCIRRWCELDGFRHPDLGLRVWSLGTPAASGPVAPPSQGGLDRAARSPPRPPAPRADAARGGGQAAQNAAQQAAETRGNERKDESGELPETLAVPSVAAMCSAVQQFRMGAGGFEPPKV